MVMMWTLVVLSCCVVLSTADVRLPPKITKQPAAEHIFEINSRNLRMECEAEGVPDVEYSWKKNQLDFDRNPENIEVEPSGGSFTFKEVYADDAGYYQCFAKNQYGMAMSQISSVQRALLGTFPTRSEPVSYEVDQGNPLVLKCDSPKCYPVPTYKWVIADDMQDKNPTNIVEDKRLMWDLNGDLHFAYVEPGDQQGGRVYMCQVYNPYLRTEKGGSESKIIVNQGTPASSRPTPQYVPEQAVVQVAGQAMTFQCIFSGFPTAVVKFDRKTGSIPHDRTKKSKQGTVMTINHVQESDEGSYICVGTNRNGEYVHNFAVDVQVIPEFRTEESKPHNMNVTEGESVSFVCDAYAEPDAKIQWYKNGEPINSDSPGPRMKVTEQGKKLTIVDLCKTCSNGGTDLMVVQCNASNIHGSAFSEGYLNVLVKTTLSTVPVDIDMSSWEANVFFPCEAISDDSTPVIITWHFNDVEIDPSNEAYEILPTGLKVDAVLLDNQDKGKAEGKYSCIANNGLSSESASANLVLPQDPARNETVTSAAVIKESGINWMLIIIIIVVVLLLLLLLLLVCCLCMQRNKGDEYPVDEKEKKAGLNPEKELADTGFHDYQRPEGQPFKGSRASLTSTIKLNESDDEESLAEYGEPDTGKFNEDGSFLGEYTEKRRPRGGDSIV